MQYASGTALRAAYEAACRAGCDVDAPRVTSLRIVRGLLEKLDCGRPTEATFRAVTAIIDQDARPQRYKTDKDCYTAHSASGSSFRQWRTKLISYGLIRREARPNTSAVGADASVGAEASTG